MTWGGVVRGVRVWNRESFPEPSDDELVAFGYDPPHPDRSGPSLAPRPYTNVCADCPALIRHGSKRCRSCYAKHRGVAPDRQPANPTVRAVAPPTRPRPHDAVDEVTVQRVLSGEWSLKTTRAEKEAVAARWVAAGGSTSALAEFTGWRVDRYVHVRDIAA